MKCFIKYILLFILPICGFFATMEILVHKIPNSYSYKYNYIKKKGENIFAISLGHSQLYDGFKPDLFKLKAFNLSNSAQSYKEDYYILKELLPFLPNLKVVIVPIGYMNVSTSNDESFTERSTFYYEYMNIDYGSRLPFCYRYEIFYPQRAFDKIISYYLRHEDIVGCDTLGQRNNHSLKNRKLKLGEEKVLTAYTVDTHDSTKMTISVGDYLDKIAELLVNNNVKMVLVSPPHYWDCFNNANKDQISFIQNFINKFTSKYHIQYINLEDDNRFVDEDFFNETHLSDIGSEKFTKILNDSVII